MQIEFMAKSYGTLAVVNVTLLAFRSRRWCEIGITRLNCECEGEREQRIDRWLHYEYALK